jgi:GDP-D-mannose dehydratase
MARADVALRAWNVVDISEVLVLRDPVATSAMVASAAPDAVLHLAAQSWVPDALRDPRRRCRSTCSTR